MDAGGASSSRSRVSTARQKGTAAQANGRFQQSAIVLHTQSSAARSCYVEIVEGLHMQFELLRGSRRRVFLLSFELVLWPIGVVLTNF